MTTIIKFNNSISLNNNEIAVIADTLEKISAVANQINYLLAYKVTKDKQSPLAKSYKEVATPLIEKIEEIANATKK